MTKVVFATFCGRKVPLQEPERASDLSSVLSEPGRSLILPQGPPEAVDVQDMGHWPGSTPRRNSPLTCLRILRASTRLEEPTLLRPANSGGGFTDSASRREVPPGVPPQHSSGLLQQERSSVRSRILYEGMLRVLRLNRNNLSIQDGVFEQHNLELFSNSMDFRKKFSDHTDWIRYVKQKARGEPVFPIHFPARLNLQPITGKGKQRHVWIIAAPNCGKTTWIESTFAGTNTFAVAAKATRPFDNYHGERVGRSVGVAPLQLITYTFRC